MLSDLSRRRAPVAGSNAPSSKKNETWLPLSRKYASDVRFWSVVLNTERGVEAGSNASTSAVARDVSDAISAGVAKSGTTRKPSERKRATCSGVRAPESSGGEGAEEPIAGRARAEAEGAGRSEGGVRRI